MISALSQKAWYNVSVCAREMERERQREIERERANRVQHNRKNALEAKVRENEMGEGIER